ncbi:putative AraC family transcriptional regulator [Paenibacillus agaridevorans]|uniref:Putative AraC family transcriptional regulator n=1 Tax=Paenibacillus agaridevorans TaxID=171404 RepID=A0A2R5F002_9BACL|nr:AraC family transcriptional regulator [Paenibacillus agaridevorans]GBG08961.1 putative AraC family transcriptional regulator [Paenibacillus agaridevorans]
MHLKDCISSSIYKLQQNFMGNWFVAGSEMDKRKLEQGWMGEDRYEAVFEPHKHGSPELYICLQGHCAMKYGDEMLALKEGDVCLLPPGVWHDELPGRSTPYQALWIRFDYHQILPILFYRDCANNILLIEGNEFQCEFEDHFIQHQLKNELEHQSSLQIELIKIYILQVLIYLLRKMENKKESNSSEKWKKSVVKRVQQYIDQNHNRVLRLSEISQEVSISANYLNSIFKSETGHTIMQYIEDYKIDKAKHYLSETDQSMNAVASSLGYYDQYHFSKIFKKETGLTPTQYRKSRA